MSGRILPGLATPGNATAYGPGSRTIPDVTMGSLASGFDEEAAEDEQLRRQNGGTFGRSTPEFSETPGRRNMPPDSPSTAAGRSMLQDTGMQTQTPVRPSRSRTSTSKSGRSDRYEEEANLGLSTRGANKVWLAVGDGTQEDDADDLLSERMDLEPSPQWEISNEDAMRSVGLHTRRATDGGGDALERVKGRPRHSVATTGNESSIIREVGGRHQLSLREQAKKTEEQDKEIWKLKLELNMLTAQLKAGLGNDAAELAQRYLKLQTHSASEIVKWKTISKELNSTLAKTNDRNIELEEQLYAAQSSDPGRIEELQEQLDEEQRLRAEDRAQLEELEIALDEAKHNRPGDETLEQLEDELSNLRVKEADLREENDRFRDQVEDLQHELEKVVDERDQALEEAENKVDPAAVEDVKRLEKDVLDLETDKASLSAELEALRLGAKARDEQRQQDQDRISHLARELEQATAQTIDLQRSVSRTGNLEAEHERLARLLSDRENEILRLKEELDRLDTKFLAQSRDMTAYQEDLDEVVDKLRRVQAERNEIDENLAETMAIIEERNEDLRTSRDQLDEALDQLEQLKEDLSVMARERDAFKAELAQADSDIDRVDESRDELATNLADMEDELVQIREAEAAARQDLEHQRLTIDELSRKLGDLEVRHRHDVDSHRKLVQERDEIQSTARRTESAHSEETQRLRKELSSELERYKQLISDKEQSNVRLSHEVEVVRERMSERDRDVRDLQTALKSLESDKRRIGDDHLDDRRSLQLEVDRIRRDLDRSQDDLEHAQQEVDRLESSLSQQRAELSEMAEEKSAIEGLLTSERQERLKLSDKLTAAEKAARQAEQELNNLRQRIEELERGSGLGRALTPRRGSDMAQKDAMTLLQSAYVKVAKLCGIEEHNVPSNFSTLKDNLLRRLRQLQSTNSEWDRQIRSLEIRLESQTSALSRELDAKKKLLDGVEHSVQKMTQTKLSWKTKLTMKDDEVADLRARLKDLQFQLSTLKMTSSTESSTEVRTLQSRATHAEKRAATLANQLSALQEASASHESRHQTAVSKWEARVREYEKRLREAGEMIKVEKQGGKERVADLEQQLRSLTAQRDAINAKTVRLESIMNMAGMGRKEDPDAL